MLFYNMFVLFFCVIKFLHLQDSTLFAEKPFNSCYHSPISGHFIPPPASRTIQPTDKSNGHLNATEKKREQRKKADLHFAPNYRLISPPPRNLSLNTRHRATLQSNPQTIDKQFGDEKPRVCACARLENNFVFPSVRPLSNGCLFACDLRSALCFLFLFCCGDFRLARERMRESRQQQRRGAFSELSEK